MTIQEAIKARHSVRAYCSRQSVIYSLHSLWKDNLSVKFELKSGKRLTRPLGHALTLSSLSKTSRDYE